MKTIRNLYRVALPGLFLVVLGAPVLAQASADDDAILKTIIEETRQGWLNADGAPFRKNFLDYEGARYVEGGGQNKGLDELIDHHVVPEADAFKSFELNYSNIETHVEGDFAWAIADTQIKAEVKRNNRVIDNKGYQTYIFRKIDGMWKIIHTHSSSRPVRKAKPKEHKADH